MSDQFLGEIRIVSFNFAPNGWAQCNGQIMPISQNTALFSLLGTYYGGNGMSNFGLPDFQGNIPVAYGSGGGLSPRDIGETGGSPTVQIDLTTLPAHVHTMNGDSNPGTTTSPALAIAAVPATGPRQPNQLYAAAAVNTSMQSNNLLPYGDGQPHNNLQPFLVMNFIIALTGVFPPRG